MNKEEIEELKDFTIDLTDIDELALGLEVCSKKSNMVIQEFADTIIQLQQENKQLKDNWNMLKEYLKNRYDNGTESISYRQVFMEIREAMQVLEIAQELEKGVNND